MERALRSRLHWFVFEFFTEMLGIADSWRGHDTLLFPKETRKEDMTTFQSFCWSKVSFYSHICLCSFSSSSSKHVFFLLREKSTETYSPLAYKEGCWGRTHLKGRHLLKPWFHYYNVVSEHSKLVIIHPQLSHLIWETFDLLNALATLCTTKYICFPII